MHTKSSANLNNLAEMYVLKRNTSIAKSRKNGPKVAAKKSKL